MLSRAAKALPKQGRCRCNYNPPNTHIAGHFSLCAEYSYEILTAFRHAKLHMQILTRSRVNNNVSATVDNENCTKIGMVINFLLVYKINIVTK